MGWEALGFFISSYYCALQRIKGKNVLGISRAASVTQGALYLLISIKLLLVLSIKTIMSLQPFGINTQVNELIACQFSLLRLETIYNTCMHTKKLK